MYVPIIAVSGVFLMVLSEVINKTSISLESNKIPSACQKQDGDTLNHELEVIGGVF